MTWTPTPGTIPALAIAHLRTQPPGTKLSTAALAEAIGHETYAFAAYLKAPRDLGMIVAERGSDIRSLFWSLPVDPDQPIGDVVNTIKGAVAEGLAKNMDRSICDLVAPTFQPEKSNIVLAPKIRKRPRAGLGPGPSLLEQSKPVEVPRDVPPAPAPAADPPQARTGTCPARWGILSDGALHVEKAGHSVALEPIEFEALADFLRRTGAP